MRERGDGKRLPAARSPRAAAGQDQGVARDGWKRRQEVRRRAAHGRDTALQRYNVSHDGCGVKRKRSRDMQQHPRAARPRGIRNTRIVHGPGTGHPGPAFGTHAPRKSGQAGPPPESGPFPVRGGEGVASPSSITPRCCPTKTSEKPGGSDPLRRPGAGTVGGRIHGDRQDRGGYPPRSGERRPNRNAFRLPTPHPESTQLS